MKRTTHSPKWVCFLLQPWARPQQDPAEGENQTQQSRRRQDPPHPPPLDSTPELGTSWNLFTNPDSPKHVESQRREEAIGCHPQSHKLQQGTELHLPYFLSAWKLRCFPSCKGSSVPKNFNKAMTSFQDRTVYGGGKPGLIIGTGKGERGIWKSSTFPATESGAAQPQPSPRWEHPKGL